VKIKCINVREGGIEKDKEYTVYGILMSGGSLHYFITDYPSWYLAEQFEIINKLLPLNWYFNFNNNDDIAICGYKELVFSENHYEDLVEREQKALEIFEKRKEEIEEFEKLINSNRGNL